MLVADEEEARYDGGRRVREEDIVMSLTAFKVREEGRDGRTDGGRNGETVIREKGGRKGGRGG